MEPELPTFDDAVTAFRRFLGGEGYSPVVQWIFRESIVDRGRKVYIRLPLLNSTSLANALYDKGVDRGLGVFIAAFCSYGERTLAYVYVPEDVEDAEHRMLSGLKFMVPVGPEFRKIAGVRSELYWKWLRWFERRDSMPKTSDDVPHRDPFSIE